MKPKKLCLSSQILTLLISFLFIPNVGLSATMRQTQKIFSGILTKKRTAFTLKIAALPGKQPKNFILNFTTPTVEKIMQRMGTGDFVSLQISGKSLDGRRLRVSDINYIGLNILLGPWLGDDDVCYDFRSFTSLILSHKNTYGECTTPPHQDSQALSRKLSYFVNPDDNGWILLISDTSAQYIAELNIRNSTTIQLSLFDKQTGSILSKVILRRALVYSD
jgi:hypothetical protein